MDVVYPFIASEQNDSEELRYSLRSLVNMSHNKVYIIGDKPSWVTNVIHIAMPQDKSKHENIRANMLAVATNLDISNNFVYMNDDFFIMKSIKEVPQYDYGDMKTLIKRYHKLHPKGSTYIDAMEKTYHLLRDRGFKEPLSYELHTPMVFNKQRIRILLAGIDDETVQFRSVYGNTFYDQSNSIEDVKIFSNPAYNCVEYNSSPLRYVRTQDFLSVSENDFKKSIPVDYIKAQFSTAYKYET